MVDAAQGMRTQLSRLQELKGHVMAELRDIVHANHTAFSRTSREIGELEGMVLSMRKLHSQLGATQSNATTAAVSAESADAFARPERAAPRPPPPPSPAAAAADVAGKAAASSTARELWALVAQLSDHLAVRQLDEAEAMLTFAEQALHEEAQVRSSTSPLVLGQRARERPAGFVGPGRALGHHHLPQGFFARSLTPRKPSRLSHALSSHNARYFRVLPPLTRLLLHTACRLSAGG